MDWSGIEPEAFCMQSRCDTTTPPTLTCLFFLGGVYVNCSGGWDREIDLIMYRNARDAVCQMTGLAGDKADELLQSVNYVLEDALYLHWCLTGQQPPYHAYYHRELLLSPTFTLTVSRRRALSNSGLLADEKKQWEEIPWTQLLLLVNQQKLTSTQSADREKCIICITDFEPSDDGQIVKLVNCKGHFFHKACILRGFSGNGSVKCPVCGQIYGDFTGNMPDGSLQITVTRSIHCDGFHHCQTWVLDYSFPSGEVEGVRYTGTQRRAYLPNSYHGREVLRLLICAFYKRLTFVVGTSVTTGAENRVIWAIHHKTSLTGGAANYGYPDPGYFDRVKSELAARGISYPV